MYIEHQSSGSCIISGLVEVLEECMVVKAFVRNRPPIRPFAFDHV